jgi:hypothetical protein
MTKSIAVAACPVLLAACGVAVESAPFKSLPPRPADHEIVLFSTKLPSCPYEEIGVVNATRRDSYTRYEALLDALKARAREMGGDAIVGLGQQQAVSGGTVIGSTVSIGSSDVLAGTVIRFTESGCTR